MATPIATGALKSKVPVGLTTVPASAVVAGLTALLADTGTVGVIVGAARG